jgi:hypothetical protein
MVDQVAPPSVDLSSTILSPATHDGCVGADHSLPATGRRGRRGYGFILSSRASLLLVLWHGHGRRASRSVARNVSPLVGERVGAGAEEALRPQEPARVGGTNGPTLDVVGHILTRKPRVGLAAGDRNEREAGPPRFRSLTETAAVIGTSRWFGGLRLLGLALQVTVGGVVSALGRARGVTCVRASPGSRSAGNACEPRCRLGSP